MELENLVKLIQTVSDSDLTGFQYEENGVKLKIQKEKEQMVVSTGAADQIPSGWNLLCSTVGRGSTICGSWRSCVKRTDGCHRRGDEADE